MKQKNQISTSISSRNSAVNDIDNSPSNTDISEWESRIAKLVGLEEEVTPPSSQIKEISPTEGISENQLIEVSKETPDPTSVRTKQPLSANPFAKAGLVGASTLVAVLFAGGFLSQIMGGGGKHQVKKNVTVQPPPVKTPNRLEQLETEVDTLKTKLALAKQAEAVKNAQQQLRRSKPKSEVVNKPSPPTPPKPTQNISPPEVITRIIREPRPVEINQTQPALPEPPPPEPEATPDPMQKWQKLAKLGSYGMVNQDISKQSTVKTASAPKRKVEPLVSRPKSNVTPKPSTSIASQRRSGSGKRTVVGSSAEGVIATAIFGETTKSRRRSRNSRNNDNSSTDSNVFVVRLEEPLKARDGEVVVPAGSEILTQVSSISDRGLMRLNVTKLLVKDKDELIEKSLPPNALTIRAPEGKPLMAKSYPNKGSSIAGRDALTFGLGGLGRAAQLFNRTETRIVRDEGAVFSETNNNDPNITAGILEGGMRSLVPQVTRRNQQAISRMSRKSDIWFLKAGKEVEVYVNQEVSL
ncbi:TrbI/VirB10 family protein [Mastigocoleus sp. MO_188.B34]|uniref:TrbI/VirB10 family protein n=1 Tax=Mastigocoleus sp. MO_188.B34 TaxID=3036635 RepID=UPI002617D2F0|nr:TrbI/VirB10 family protein [Mastigocoleus sp. MO_188.B34]MDJ0694631.1 TrbI/VirB10 family protein [Mastigocoleus sp. MO_188.B34]